jgi:hypothetical protein
MPLIKNVFTHLGKSSFFVDDVNIHNNDWSEHLEHLMLVFERLMFSPKIEPGKMLF